MENYMMMKPLEVYSLVVQGKLRKFPNHYLDKEAVKEIVRYVVLNQYNYTREDVLSKIDQNFLSKNFLGGARKFFDMTVVYLLIYCFPEWNFKAWEFKNVPVGFWKERSNLKDLVLWIAEKEGLDPYSKEGLRKITANTVLKYCGSTPLTYSGGIYEMLDTISPGKYKKWEITKVAVWSREDVVVATKWLVEEKLNYTPEQACKIKVSDFAENNLDGMLQKACNHSVHTALEMVYPGRYYRSKSRKISLVC